MPVTSVSAGEPFRVGVNYWPRRKAMGWWSNFDADEVRDEFDLIRDVGLGLVRIFLLWEDFQPTANRVDPAAIERLRVTCDIAAERGLGLDITFFTGHMSGPNWAPGWLLDGSRPRPGSRDLVSGGRVVASGYRNPYVDPAALAAQRRQVQTVVRALLDHPAIWVWNLGNEPDLFALPPDDAAGPAWAQRLSTDIRELDDRHPITCGLHAASLEADNGLRVDRIFATCDLAVMHAYPAYTTWAAGPLDPELVPFTAALTASLAGRPVLAEEFGGCTAPPGEPSQTWTWTDGADVKRRQFMAGEEDLAEHLGRVLPILVDVGAVGALVWCFADYDTSLWDRPPCLDQHHERHFGLVRPDGSLKPHAFVLREFAASKPIIQEPSARARMDLGPDAFYRDPMAHLPALYDRFRGMTPP
jgi:endo-1,4-beta-mannosidase